MPAAWPVLPLGTMINQQNTPDDQASAQRPGHRDPLLGTETLCLQLPLPVPPIPSTKASRDGGGLQSPQRGVPRGGGHPGTRLYVAELLSLSQDMPKSQSGQEE